MIKSASIEWSLFCRYHKISIYLKFVWNFAFQKVLWQQNIKTERKNKTKQSEKAKKTKRVLLNLYCVEFSIRCRWYRSPPFDFEKIPRFLLIKKKKKKKNRKMVMVLSVFFCSSFCFWKYKSLCQCGSESYVKYIDSFVYLFGTSFRVEISSIIELSVAFRPTIRSYEGCARNHWRARLWVCCIWIFYCDACRISKL